jgi:hypothetical protein
MPSSPWSFTWKLFEFHDSQVFVRSMTLREAMAFESDSPTNPTGAMIALVVACCLDGDRLALTTDRVMDLPTDKLALIANRIVEISKPASVESIAKN